jgi:hypothetical protein
VGHGKVPAVCREKGPQVATVLRVTPCSGTCAVVAATVAVAFAVAVVAGAGPVAFVAAGAAVAVAVTAVVAAAASVVSRSDPALVHPIHL